MDDYLPPQIDVALPGGRVVRGELLSWRQAADGTWTARVTIDVPQPAVRPVDGQVYEHVPRDRQYVMVANTRATPPTSEIHTAGCWSLSKPKAWQRVTAMPDAAMAVGMLKFPTTTACPLCEAKTLTAP